MREVRKILCVVDPAQFKSPAVQRAAWLAAAIGAQLELLAVCYADLNLCEPLQGKLQLNRARSDAVDDLRRELMSVADELQREFKISINANAVWDTPLHEGIVRYAKTEGASLVMKDACYNAALRMTVLSNQDWQLIRCCSLPLWIVKRDTLPASKRFIAAVDPLHKNDKPAELDDAILRLGETLATATGDGLHAFHSFDPRIAMSAAENNVYIPVSLPLSDIEEQMREQHTLRFAQVVESYGIPAQRQHLVTGLTDEELPRLAEQLDATAVVMGAIARNATKRIFIGSTAERTLNRLPCDLIIVKPDWFETPVPANSDADLATVE